jgi:predicted nuclease with TOPRIM domain
MPVCPLRSYTCECHEVMMWASKAVHEAVCPLRSLQNMLNLVLERNAHLEEKIESNKKDLQREIAKVSSKFGEQLSTLRKEKDALNTHIWLLEERLSELEPRVDDLESDDDF